MKPQIRTISGKRMIVFSTEVEIEECVDVDVSLDLSECIDDIVDAMTNEHFEMIARKTSRVNGSVAFMTPYDFKRQLCDMVEMNYHCTTEQLLNGILNRL
jgi:hypothetical protein